MEQIKKSLSGNQVNEPIEKPEWVEIVETFPEVIRQQVGNTCIGVISSLVQLYYMESLLYDAIIEESRSMIKKHFEDIEKRNNADV